LGPASGGVGGLARVQMHDPAPLRAPIAPSAISFA